MAGNQKQPVSFDDIIKAGRQKRKNEQLAQDIFGKNRRQSAPAAANTKKAPIGGSLASRVGVTKRTASIPRSNSSTPRNGRGPTRPPLLSNKSHRAANVPSRLAPEPRNQDAGRKAAVVGGNGGNISIRGAAGGPYVVVASNFAPGTTAADIDSVMRSVGGELQFCRLIAAQPTVIAEMGFTNVGDADKVIETFNNKRADGRLLHVYYKDSSVAVQPIAQPIEEPVQVEEEEMMEVDQTVGAREAENRLREERRGRDDRDRREVDRREVFPSGPRGGRGYYEDWQGSRPQPGYNDGRYGGGQGGGYSHGPRDRMPSGPRYGRGGSGGGQGWRS